jgi:hypothetical protein
VLRLRRLRESENVVVPALPPARDRELEPEPAVQQDDEDRSVSDPLESMASEAMAVTANT